MASKEKQPAGNRTGFLYGYIRRIKKELVTVKQDVDIKTIRGELIANLAHTRQELHEVRTSE